MTKYRIKGIAHPGRVNLPRLGTIALADISDELAEELYKSGCPFLEPVPDHTGLPQIEVKPTPTKRKTKNKPLK